MKLTEIQCWIHIHSVPLKYWKSNTIFFIACGVDTSLSLDDYTINKSPGVFAYVSVDVDLLFELRIKYVFGSLTFSEFWN